MARKVVSCSSKDRRWRALAPTEIGYRDYAPSHRNVSNGASERQRAHSSISHSVMTMIEIRVVTIENLLIYQKANAVPKKPPWSRCELVK